MSAMSPTTAAGSLRDTSLGTRFAMGAFWAVGGAVLSRGMTLAASVLAGRILGAEGFGEISMIQSTQGLFGVLAGAGIGLAATKFVAEHRSIDATRARRCILLSILIALVSGLIGAAALLAFSGTLAESVLMAPHLDIELQVATALILFGAINGVQNGALAGLGDFRLIAFLNVIRGAFLFVALLLGIQFGGVLGGVIGLVATEIVAVVTSQVALQRIFPVRLREVIDSGFAWQEFAALVHFSGLAILASLATTLAMWYSNVVLATQPDGYASLGVFNAAERWRQVLLFLPASISPILLSMLSNLHGKKNGAEYRRLIGMNLWVSVIVVALPTAGLMLLAPLAMSVFGAEYTNGAGTLILLAASAIAVVLNNLLGQVLISQGAMFWRFATDLLLAGVLAVSAWWIIPAWQDQGLALGHLLAYGATVLALIAPVMWYLKRSHVATPVDAAPAGGEGGEP